MELVRERGRAPRFPFELFREQERIYTNSHTKRLWKSLEDLQSAAEQEPVGCRILGCIDKATAEKILAWEHGELYAVGYGGAVLFCLPGGTVVV